MDCVGVGAGCITDGTVIAGVRLAGAHATSTNETTMNMDCEARQVRVISKSRYSVIALLKSHWQ